MSSLTSTSQALMAKGKGLLAMDESVGTCNRRLAEFGIAQTEASRRRYRELLVTAPGLAASISGVILYRAHCNGVAAQGQYCDELEGEGLAA